MAKRISPFADDFKELSQTAEKTVLAFKNQTTEHSKAPNTKTDDEPKDVSVELEPDRMPADSGHERKSADSKKTKPSKPKNRTVSVVRPEREWGKPTALFNTRIPPEMSELLDDLVYRLKKKRAPKSKQDLAQEAICDLLSKHKML